MDICLLVSGNLGYKILLEVCLAYNVRCVLTDRQSEEIISFCKLKDIVFFAGNPRNGKISDLINKVKIDVILSINYLFLIDHQIIHWPRKYAINIHGSLLPKFRGRTPHVWAIINNEKETGITAHLIDEGCDTGPIISQLRISIEDNDTGASLLEKYKEKYPELVRRVLEGASNGTLELKAQDHSKATYFSKRTPEDGEINWNWQKERIFNWVRALAHPYPGAFTYFNEKRIRINKVVFSNIGYSDNVDNGSILMIEDGNPIVKTQNGAIKIVNFDLDPGFKVNGKFYGKY
ncbi:methionyl-tRNA formyltransferase [Rufibacter radiotolerans]|uniref:methionyl-tRNA formyltransferase n=1 Tax=Rufibacter radiotolerans TaxID=1379910 RepID=UPI00066467F8|nr:methionyl-tRNA formyltransferase [Rufibacter radiotolerans]